MSGALVPVESGAPVEVLPGVCDDTCKGCIFRSWLHSWTICDFIGITGYRRGCPAGKGCTRRIVGDKGRSISQLIFLGQAAAAEAALPKKPGRPKGPALTPKERRKRANDAKKTYRERVHAALGGRQTAVLKGFLKETGISVREMAVRIGVSEYTLAHWIAEHLCAKWDKLADLGIQKPEGLPEGLGRGGGETPSVASGDSSLKERA
ncbi:MAG: hypothetical protein IKO91_00635 [Oscillospiraceae bacterium]|nr:hypothetical protein [Oscillospiraceae bacterium]